MKLQNLRIQKKGQAQKDMNEMHMRKRHLFCRCGHQNVPYEKQEELNKGLSPEMNVLARARAQLHYISTHLSVPHGENIYKTVLYI